MLIAALVVAYLLVGACVAGLTSRFSSEELDSAEMAMVILFGWPFVALASSIYLVTRGPMKPLLALAAWIGRRRP